MSRTTDSWLWERPFSKGSPAAASDRRPISFAPIPFKVLECIFRDNATVDLRKKPLLYGFVSGCVCLMSLLSKLNLVAQFMSNGYIVSICFFEFRKAFDILNHKCFCARVIFQLCINDVVSEKSAIPRCVLQGSLINTLEVMLYLWSN